MRQRTSSLLLAFAFGVAFLSPVGRLLAEEPPPVVAEINWYKLTDVGQSTDPTYSAFFGGALVSGFNTSAIQVNGQPVQGSFASFKWAQTPALRPEVQVCLDRAMGAANLMETQVLIGSLVDIGGRNTSFRIRVTGSINVNTGNTRVNPGDWTILEVASFRTMVCTVSTFIP
jgi:hypothetical protein